MIKSLRFPLLAPVNETSALPDVISTTTQNDSESSPVSQASARNRSGKALIALAFIFFLFVVVKNAWLSDDSYITFRTVDNFLHGYGPTWNTDERVQTFTHPLWMFALSASTFFIHNIYYSSILLSITVSAIAVALVAFKIIKSPIVATLGVVMLAASKAFVDFSTSGLENPLTHLLIALFALVFFNYRDDKRAVLWLSLLGALMALNRMDTVLLFLPALLYIFYKFRSWKTLRTMALAFSPFLLWELFSLFYYGFLFPNTAYAKLNTGIPSGELLRQGINYLISSCSFDPLLFLIPLVSLLLVWIMKDWRSLPLLFGVALYVAYTVKVGGDFMAGRFLTPSYMITAIVLLRNIQPDNKQFLLALAVITIFVAFVTPGSPWYQLPQFNTPGTVFSANGPDVDSRGVADERSFYVQSSGILVLTTETSMPDHPWTREGLQARAQHLRVVVKGNIGFFGYWAGPDVHIVDPLALGDPLLARLPAQSSWRIGHFGRTLPDGYLQTLETGKNVIKDPDLAQYYDQLRLIIHGPLFSWQRIVAIWQMNTGMDDHLLDRYIHTIPQAAANVWRLALSA